MLLLLPPPYSLIWQLSATGDIITRRVRAHTYPGYTHTHTQTAKQEKKPNLACPLLSLLIWQLTTCIEMCVCVCVCVRECPGFFSYFVPATIQWQTSKLPSLLLCVCECACRFRLSLKEANLFREWQLVQSFSPNNEKCVGWAAAKTAPTPTHTHTQTQRDKYSYWACKKRRHNYCPYNWLAWLSKAHKGSARTLHNN